MISMGGKDIKEAFLHLKATYSIINEDKINKSLTNDILMDKEVLNSRDKRRIKASIKRFKKVKSSINSALFNILKNIDLIEPLDKTIKILEGFDNIENQSERINNLKDSALVLRNTLIMYRFLIEKRIMQEVYQLRYLNDNILDFNDFLSLSDKIPKEQLVYIQNFLNYFDEVPNTAKGYDIEYRLFSKNSEINREFNKKITINEKDLEELFERFTNLESSLLEVQNENFKRKANEDTLFIRRNAGPQIIAISSSNLKALKESEMLTSDMLMLKSEIDSVRLPENKSTALKFLNGRIEKLKEKMEEILYSELVKNDNLGIEQFNIEEFILQSIEMINKYDEELVGIKSNNRL